LRRNSRVSLSQLRGGNEKRAESSLAAASRILHARPPHTRARARFASHASAALTLDCARHTLDAIRETIVSPHRFKRCGLSQECAAAALSATDIPTCDRTNLVPNSFQAFTSSFTANNDAPGRVIFRRPRQAGRTGSKTPGGAGTHRTHTGHADARRHTDRTDEPHNHRNPPTTHNPHVSATTEAATDSQEPAGPGPTAPAADSEEAAPSEPDPASTRSQSASPRLLESGRRNEGARGRRVAASSAAGAPDKLET
jgi:hypothetical protein